MSTTASLESTDVQLDPGDVIAIPLQIHNTGQVVEGYRIEIVGAPSAWAEVEPATLSLYPGSSTTATVTFRPPRSHDVPAGEQRFGVVVTPTEHPDEAVVPEGVIEVLPFLETLAELVPRTSQGRSRGRHQVAVDNRGNVPVTTLLEGKDDGDKLKLAFKPPAITVGPGEARFVDVRVKPRQRIWRGSPVTYPFQVVVSAQETTAVTLDGTHVQQPTVPSWLPKALLALLALLAALVALWFLLLKPTIESQAKEAVEDEVAAAEESAQQADENAGAAEQSAAGAQAAKEHIDKQVKKGLPPTLQATPVSARLTSASPEDGIFQVPADKSLALTDLVFSNPQGDFGRARVIVAGNPTFDIALENFRDLDYHFVTPLEAGPGKTVQLDVDCRQPGKPPDSPAPDTCDIAMFMGGSLVDLPPEENTGKKKN